MPPKTISSAVSAKADELQTAPDSSQCPEKINKLLSSLPPLVSHLSVLDFVSTLERNFRARGVDLESLSSALIIRVFLMIQDADMQGYLSTYSRLPGVMESITTFTKLKSLLVTAAFPTPSRISEIERDFRGHTAPFTSPTSVVELMHEAHILIFFDVFSGDSASRHLQNLLQMDKSPVHANLRATLLPQMGKISFDDLIHQLNLDVLSNPRSG